MMKWFPYLFWVRKLCRQWSIFWNKGARTTCPFHWDKRMISTQRSANRHWRVQTKSIARQWEQHPQVLSECKAHQQLPPWCSRAGTAAVDILKTKTVLSCSLHWNPLKWIGISQHTIKTQWEAQQKGYGSALWLSHDYIWITLWSCKWMSWNMSYPWRTLPSPQGVMEFKTKNSSFIPGGGNILQSVKWFLW